MSESGSERQAASTPPDRRTFLKLVGAGAAGGILAGLAGCQSTPLTIDVYSERFELLKLSFLR